MNNYEDWAHLVARKLKGEADVIAAIEKDELDDAAAAEAFVRMVLKPFIPENYGIGAGRIVDAFGNRSDYMDVVIYNRSFPRIGLRGTQSDFLYESVLASFVIRAKYLRKTFFESMDACASMSRLMTNIDKAVLVQLARKNGLKPGPNQTFVHEDPLRTARFELIGSPPVFMFGFTGIKHSYRQLQENIELWITQHIEDEPDLPMRAFPAVIATQGCFAWRNAAPLALSNREMLGVGNDEAPVRLIVLQLLYLLNRRLHVTTDGYGLKPNLSAYLGQFKAPTFEIGIGDVDALVKMRLPDDQKSAAQQDKRIQSARDHAPEASAKPAQTPADKPAQTTAAESFDKDQSSSLQQAAARASAAFVNEAKASTAKVETAKVETSEPEKSGTSSGVFDKPSPFASKPAPVAARASASFANEAKTTTAMVETAKAETSEPEKSATSSGVFDKPSPFASKPAPVAGTSKLAEADVVKPFKPPSAPLGSAPIPGIGGTFDKTETPAMSALDPMSLPELDAGEPAEAPPTPAAAPTGSASVPPSRPIPSVVPPKPAVDIELTNDIKIPSEANSGFNKIADPLDFESTIIIPPDATLSNKPSTNSNGDFIDRVKKQLSNSDSADDEDEAFIQTTRL
jgi:hypothetical protein